jgi:SNF2 family DNA or RNA helicase
VAKRNNLLYSSLYDEYASDVYGPYKKALTNVNNLLMQLRKLCNHPFLVLEDVHTIPDAMYYEQLVSASGKLFVIDKLLTKLLRDGSKVRTMDLKCIVGAAIALSCCEYTYYLLIGSLTSGASFSLCVSLHRC